MQISPKERILPNGVKVSITDEIETRRNNEATLQASDVIGMRTDYVNLDYARIPKPTDSKMYGNTSTAITFSLEGYTPTAINP
ncbi:hypothetical protein [Anaerosolibacter sp.]|uniref:hypothetical protein n=1 Tax=Anaerosolibacter sp. TaxID=1872527 RepID=UPI0039EE1264